MYRISKLFTVLLLSIGLCAAQAAIPFHLLSSSDSGTTKNVREFEYNVSVEQHLEVQGIKNVICQVIRTEKPVGYEILSLGIYYKLDRYIAEAERDVAEGARHREQRIAQYHW